MSVKPIPDGYHTVTPYLTVSDAAQALEFYKRAFGATEIMRFEMPDGRIGHAEIRLGSSAIMVSDEFPDFGIRGPKALGGTPVKIHLYVEDVDAFCRKALAAGGEVLEPVKDQFWGNRSGQIVDPFGHIWFVATHKEDVSMEEMHRRMQEMCAESK